MPDPRSPCGTWRATVRRLGARPQPAAEIGVLARIEDGGAVTVYVDGRAAQPGVGAWRPAGPGRVVVVAEWLDDGAADQARPRMSVHAAVELAHDGRTAQLRLQWNYLAANGEPLQPAVAGEARATRLEP